MEWLKTLGHLTSQMSYGEEVADLHRKLVVMEQELERLESSHDPNTDGNGSGERIARLRSCIAESKAKIAGLV